MHEGYFVDWLSISQDHGSDTPELVGSIHFKLDEFGAVQDETGGSVTHKGSHGTSLQIRSHGGRVSVSGNPGRFGRADNLFGLDLDSCIEICNTELARLDLPGFTKGLEMRPSNEEIERGLPSKWTGATFSRIDITRGFETGSEFAARLVMRAYQRKNFARMTRSVWGGDTAIWKTQRRTVKAYLKGPEMKAHGKSGDWCDYATSRGIVRHEVELRAKLLSETRLRYWGNCTMGNLIQLHVKETEGLQEIETHDDPIAVESLQGRVRLTYAAWLKGENVKQLLTRATFYRHRGELLRTASIDIAEPRDIAFVQPRVHVVELRPAVAPREYWLRAA